MEFACCSWCLQWNSQLIHTICWRSRSYWNPLWHLECAKISWLLKSTMNEKDRLQNEKKDISHPPGKTTAVDRETFKKKIKSSTAANWPSSKEAARGKRCAETTMWEWEREMPIQTPQKTNRKAHKGAFSSAWGDNGDFVICRHHKMSTDPWRFSRVIPSLMGFKILS